MAIYLSRRWNVKPGLEDEFRRRWRESADQLAAQLPDATFRLLRDTERPLCFQSIGGPIASAAELAAITSSGQFRAGMDAMADVIDSVELAALEVDVEIGS